MASVFFTVLIPFGLNIVGFVAGAMAALVAGSVAIFASPFFLLSAHHVPHWAYVNLHLIVGALATLMPGYNNLLAKYFTYPPVVAICASLAAWLYVILMYPPKNIWLETIKLAKYRAIVLPVGIGLLVSAAFVPPKHDPGIGLQDRQPTPNNALQRPALKRMLFAFAKNPPFSSAAELIR